MNSLSILLIGDEEELLQSLKGFLRLHGYEVFTADNGQARYAIAKEKTIDLVITDNSMPGWNGLMVLQKMKELDPDIDVVMMTNGGSIEEVMEIMKDGRHDRDDLYDYLIKPIDLGGLDNLMKRVKDKRFLISENRQFKRTTPDHFS